MVGLTISAHNPPVNIAHVESLYLSQLPDRLSKVQRTTRTQMPS